MEPKLGDADHGVNRTRSLVEGFPIAEGVGVVVGQLHVQTGHQQTPVEGAEEGASSADGS